MTTKTEPSLVVAACMIVNSIDPTAEADPDTMLLARRTDTHIVIITHRGQKFTVPIGTAKVAAEASAEAQAKPTTTIKAGTAQPAKTVKKTSRKRPATTQKNKT